MEQFLPPLHLACSDDELRPDMQIIKVINGVASASNGVLLVRIEIEKTSNLDASMLEKLNNKHIHCEVWKEMHKADNLIINDDCIDVYKNGIQKTLYFTTPQSSLWNDDTLIADIKQKGIEAKTIIAYTPQLINTLAKIFQHDCIIFSFSPGNNGTVCFPYQGSGMMAILMPKMTDDGSRYFV